MKTNVEIPSKVPGIYSPKQSSFRYLSRNFRIYRNIQSRSLTYYVEILIFKCNDIKVIWVKSTFNSNEGLIQLPVEQLIQALQENNYIFGENLTVIQPMVMFNHLIFQ